MMTHQQAAMLIIFGVCSVGLLPGLWRRKRAAQSTTASAPASATERPAKPGETCTCGRPAVVVYLTDRHGEVPYCRITNGGAR